MCMGKLQLILDSVRNSISDPASVITAVKLGWLKIHQSLKGWEGGNELSAGKKHPSLALLIALRMQCQCNFTGDASNSYKKCSVRLKDRDFGS